jgi:hypothetical protein
MATSPITTDTKMALRPETLTYGVIGERVITGKDNAGNDLFKTDLNATINEKAIAKAKENGTLLFEQTVSFDLAGTIEGFTQVIKDTDECVDVFNAGVKSARITPRVRTLLTAVDEQGNPSFQPVEGSYDIRELINEEATKKNLTPTEKALRALRPLFPHKSDAELMGLIGMFAASEPAMQEEVTA